MLTLAGVGSVLLLVIVGRLFVSLLGKITEGKLAADTLLPLLALGALKTVILLLPFGLLLAIMLSLGRLYRDSEMYALKSCGAGFVRIYRPVLMLTVPLALLLLLLVMFVSPWSVGLAEQIELNARQSLNISGLSPGQFVELQDGKLVILVQGADTRSGVLRNVFVYSKDKDIITLETAEQATQTIDTESGVRRIILRDGYRYEGAPGSGEYKLLSFKSHALRIPDIDLARPDNDPELLSMSALFNSNRPADKAELQWRLSVPLSALLLALLALPLSATTPRQGKYSRLVLAIFIYMIYANLLIASVKWIERGELSAIPGLWWVHILLFLLACALTVRQNGIHWTFSRRVSFLQSRS